MQAKGVPLAAELQNLFAALNPRVHIERAVEG